MRSGHKMKLLVYFTASVLVGLGSTVPTFNKDEIIYITADILENNHVIYAADHDIVNLLLVPSNILNNEDNATDEEYANNTLFFVLAENENGVRVDQGLYVLKDGIVTKLLDHGRDAVADSDARSTVYFGAKDGIYIYNEEENKAEKFGTITDSIIYIVKVKSDDIMYILTEDHVLYKVTKNGTEKEKIEAVVNAQKIVLDYQDNLYYYTPDKNIYILRQDEPEIIKSLPEEISYIDILKPSFILENGIPVIVDNTIYIVTNDGTGELSNLRLEMKPTAYSMEATLIQYFAYNKKIYEFDLLNILYNELLKDIPSS